MIFQLGISVEDIEDTIVREQTVMRRREELYRGGNRDLDLHSRSAILVDDGLAAGSTMLPALRHARRLDPARVIIGVPLGSKEARWGCWLWELTTAEYARRWAIIASQLHTLFATPPS